MFMALSFSHGGISYDVTGDFTPGSPGALSGPPERCYPPEDPEFEVDTVVCEDPEVVTESLYDNDDWYGALLDAASEKLGQINARERAERDW